MIYIDFFGGLHGNFIAYVINSLDKKFDRSILPFTDSGTSHKPYNKTLAIADHYTIFNLPVPPDAMKLSITADIDDCLLVNLLSLGRAGDFNFDLRNFNINFYDQIKNTTFADLADNIQRAYNYDVSKFNSVPRGILREYFKFGFKDYAIGGIWQESQKLEYLDQGMNFNFKKLYSLDTFISLIDDIVKYYKLPIEVDQLWLTNLWNKFIVKVDAIKLNNESFIILDNIKSNQSVDIDFNLIQEAWLNGQLEKIYNIEMPFHQEEYFKNTNEIIEFIKSKV